MTQVEVKTRIPYTVEIGHGLLASAGERVRAVCGGARACRTSGLLVSPPEYAIMEVANLLTPFSRADQWEVFCR